MTEHNEISFDLLKANKGNFIYLGGKGIVDGLSLCPCKSRLYRIQDTCPSGGFFHAYRRRIGSKLPVEHFNQTCVIFTPKEQKAMPVYN